MSVVTHILAFLASPWRKRIQAERNTPPKLEAFLEQIDQGEQDLTGASFVMVGADLGYVCTPSGEVYVIWGRERCLKLQNALTAKGGDA